MPVMRLLNDPRVRLLLEKGRHLSAALPLWAGALFFATLGVALGMGAFTFHYAKGTSYLTSDPKACANCHIMNDQYASWQRSSHRSVAVCVDCHLPHALVPKMVAKGENGYHHSKAFTLQDFHEPIQIKAKNARILQDNCLRCHTDLTDGMLSFKDGHDRETGCVKCHAAAGHGGSY